MTYQEDVALHACRGVGRHVYTNDPLALRADATTLFLATGFAETPLILTLLLDAGADPAARTDFGETALDAWQRNSALEGTDVRRQLLERQSR